MKVAFYFKQKLRNAHLAQFSAQQLIISRGNLEKTLVIFSLVLVEGKKTRSLLQLPAMIWHDLSLPRSGKTRSGEARKNSLWGGAAGASARISHQKVKPTRLISFKDEFTFY